MKKLFILLMMIMLFISCQQNEETLDGMYQIVPNVNGDVGLPALTFGNVIHIEDNKCLLYILGIASVRLDIEKGEENRYYMKLQGVNYLIKKIDNDTIEMYLLDEVSVFRKIKGDKS